MRLVRLVGGGLDVIESGVRGFRWVVGWRLETSGDYELVAAGMSSLQVIIDLGESDCACPLLFVEPIESLVLTHGKRETVHGSHFSFILKFLCFGFVCWSGSISPYSLELG